MGTLLFIILLLLFIMNVPIAVALGLSASIVLLIQDQIPLLVIIQKMFNATDSFPLMAVPFFILAGKLMETGGISRRLIAFANTIVGRVPGGLSIVAIITAMFFAAISGSAAATTAAVGSLLIPVMVKKGYDINYATAVPAAGGTVGVMIPPSVPLVLYGVAASTSISDLFLAGIGPGVFVTFSLVIVAFIISYKRGYGGGEKSSVWEFFHTLKDAILALLMPVIILGGIYGGIFTPTEAAVVAVVYGLIVGLFVYREIKWKDLSDIFSSSVTTTAVIMFIIANASIFGFLLTREQIPREISNMMLSVTQSEIVTLLIINGLLLIIGTFLETAAAIIILTPILVPIVQGMGIDLVHFGIIMTVNLAIGMITPPVGINLFVGSNIAGIKMEPLVQAIIPFILIMIVDVLIISFFPGLSLFLLD
ncbi:TRAP transporter large permease [Microaerobacter geothermalis]|uniref:TRAP transporter large permease n=1 Tax=Microaerobacter geothermalis TaxID=674972 RepID=UPI001F3FAA8F|nr:TRAP transporter large permease [Microaerobacter geothermalis]MCF6094840.1 TRAP transporter large permease [Microaerobacter geothermalis]